MSEAICFFALILSPKTERADPKISKPNFRAVLHSLLFSGKIVFGIGFELATKPCEYTLVNRTIGQTYVIFWNELHVTQTNKV